ncbi:Sensor protein KdpD [Ferriphaselus amnicola]|uniref:histidine kinase n=1 Tax=Ferriphaselus amnicola TaxID=1188319 RepID=A0A2Z6GDV4_9PROT|nr:DUF4118 domain-containing protein [Ferriphaselus amnicola]BBE51657.1 Sensor protein KdpD [Ferriphaselus amnicola]
MDTFHSSSVSKESGLVHQLWAIVACVLMTLVTQPLRDLVDLANIVMLFLLTVAIIAVWLGRKPAITASLVSIGLFDFFYVPPRFSFSVNDAQYLITFTVMLMVALIISHLTAGLRQNAIEAQRREQQIRALYALAQQLAGALTVEQASLDAQRFIRHLGMELHVLVPTLNEVLLTVGGEPVALDVAEMMVAKSVFSNNEAMELRSESPTKLVLPLSGVTRPRGVILVSAEREVLALQRPLLEAVASLMATALDRLHFVEVAQQHRMQMLTERLRSSILAALSHDVRTPLTVLYGLADTLTLPQYALPESAKETACAIRDQSLRLNNLVNNLLDMARLHAGQVQLRKEWQPIEEVIGASIKLLGVALQRHPVKVHLAADLPLIEFDAVLLERVFCNLLENAAKYAPLDTDIVMSARVVGVELEVTVANAGTGFPPDKLLKVFEPFERGIAESPVAGVGMGLAICRAVIEAHGGEISASNPESGGACVRFTLPLGEPPVIEQEAGELP